jgi:CRP/FNR family transcriptional regulator
MARLNAALQSDETSPWIRLDLSMWNDLLHDKIPRLYKKKTFLFQHGENPDSFFIIKSGRVRITSYHPAGGEKQLYVAETGAIFGELACIQNAPYAVSAIAIVDSMIYRLPFKLLEAKMQSDWSLTKSVMQIICRKSHVFIEQVLELSFNLSIERVARILLNIAAQYGQPRPDGGIRISIKFTHQDVASMINTSRVTTSNIFNAFADQGLLVRERGHYILKDLEKLKAYTLET